MGGVLDQAAGDLDAAGGGDRDGLAAAPLALDRHDAGRQQRAALAEQGGGGALVVRRCGRGGTFSAMIQRLRLSRRVPTGAKRVPICSPASRRISTSGALPAAITMAVPARVASSAAWIFVNIPPVPRCEPAAPARA